MQSFLDPVWQHGMDDSPDLNINCVIKYRVDEEKKAALRKAKEASEGGGGHPMAGVPGAISRLGWYLENKSQEGSEAKEIRRAMKNIEGYFSRNFEVDGNFVADEKKPTLAGAGRMTAVQMARRTEFERVGGRRSSVMVGVAKKGREQLANWTMANPQGAGAFGVNPKNDPMNFDQVAGRSDGFSSLSYAGRSDGFSVGTTPSPERKSDYSRDAKFEKGWRDSSAKGVAFE